jgi:colicin import membrane protein
MITITIQAETAAQYQSHLQTLINGLGAAAPVAPLTFTIEGDPIAEKLAAKKAENEAAEKKAEAAKAEAAKAEAAAAKKAAAKIRAAKESAEAAAKAAEEAAEADDADLDVLDAEPSSQWTKEDVEAKLKGLARNGFNDDVKAIISSTGAARLSAIDPMHYDDVMSKASALEMAGE